MRGFLKCPLRAPFWSAQRLRPAAGERGGTSAGGQAGAGQGGGEAGAMRRRWGTNGRYVPLIGFAMEHAITQLGHDALH